MSVSFDFSGPEELVNSATTAFQGNPEVVALAGGGYVIVWNDESGLGGDASGSAVKAQLYQDDGTPVGGEFLINQATDGHQSLASVTALAGGGFAVAWTTHDLGYTTGAGLARVFTAAGVPLGDEFMVPTASAGWQQGAILAGQSGGGFVAVWTDYGPSGTTFDGTLRGQIFAADGARSGSVFDIAVATSGSQYIPAIAVLTDGRFVVTWTDYLPLPATEPGRDDSVGGVQGRIFAANGASQGAQFAINDLTSGLQSNSTVAALEGGGFVVGWWDYSGPSGAPDIRARRFDLHGTAVEGSFVVNVTTAGAQQTPKILSWEGGGFIVAWGDRNGTADEPDSAIRARTFSSTGIATSGEQRLNSLLPGDQAAHSLAVLADGTMVSAWDVRSYNGIGVYDGSGASVFARRFTVSAETTGLDEVFGTIGDDHLTASPGGAVLHGYGGGDVLEAGNQGNDQLIGGLGSDLLVVDWGDSTESVRTDYDPHLVLFDVVEEATPETLNTWSAGGTRGIYSDGSGRTVNFREIERYDITTGAGNDRLYVGSGIVRTGDGADYVYALAGPVEFYGGDGSDYFVSSVAADIFDGGEGGNLVDYRLSPVGIGLALPSVAGTTFAGPGGDQLRNVRSIVGTAFGDTLTGNDEDNSLDGGAGGDVIEGRGGSDHLYGGPGNDTLRGGAGDDYYDITDAGDVVVELAGEGRDTLYVSASYVLAPDAAIEHAWLSSGPSWPPGPPPALDFTGSNSGQIVDGNDAANVLKGMGGNDWLRGYGGDDRLEGGDLGDTLDGGPGADVLIGGAGADTMTGGAGDDWYYVDYAFDGVNEGPGGGNDRVSASVSFTLGAGVQVEMMSTADNLATTAINLTGNELVNLIYGNAGANVLDGKGGVDTMVGFGGNDWYFVDNVGDLVNEGVGGGTLDRISASLSYTLGAGVQVEMMSTSDNLATTAINLTGNELVNLIYGNAGANVLDGRGGADTMVGFEGNDWYYVDNAGDLVNEGAGGGTLDRISASLSYTLGAGVQVELMSTADNLATTAINLGGNELANLIYGNAGANVLDGRGGADTLVGFGGNDWYYVDNAGDLINEGAGGGAGDRVFASTGYTLGAGTQVEIVSTSDNLASTAINLNGNELGQYIYGNAGANVLDGKGSADALIGFGGADTFRFTTALGGGNIDSLSDYNVADDTIQLDDAVFTGLAAGALAAGAFRIGSAPADADDRIIYDSASGALYFDADGNGASAAVHFATLVAGLALTEVDFLVI